MLSIDILLKLSEVTKKVVAVISCAKKDEG